MRVDKEAALKLRRQGKSYNEICQSLGMSKSTLTNWFKGTDFSEAVKTHLMTEVQNIHAQRLVDLNRTRGALLKASYFQAEQEAIAEMQKYVRNPLFIAAIAAYWGEGDKATNGLVRIINTDPQMIRLFKCFLIEICKVPESKLRGALYIYQDLNEASCKTFWKEHTGLKHFHKTMVLPSRHKSKKIQHGMCSLLVSSTYLKRKMLIWIDQLPEMVLNVPVQ